MKNKTKISNKNFFYPILIFAVWFVVYLLTQAFLMQNFGWDEVSYMSQAKGIATDFDFSSRAYTVMGVLKHGYPTNLINFPLFAMYLAVFFKLFGVSLKVAYFSSWLCALGVCLLIYFIFLLLVPEHRKLAFGVSIAYLLFPGILKTCDSAMMEQAGCFLVCLATYLILKDYVKGVFNYSTVLKFVLSFLVLWLYKSLFVGFFFGAFIFIIFAYSPKISGKKLSTKIPLWLFILLSYGIFIVLYLICEKFVFLPVAPMMNFTPTLEAKQLYSDFLGGFFYDLPGNISTNLTSFFNYVVAPYFIYPLAYTNPASQFFVFVPHVVYLIICFFIFVRTFVFTFAAWKNLLPQARLFIGLTLGMIISFNVIFNFLFSTTYENMWRYNVYSLPLFLCYVVLIFQATSHYLKQFMTEHPVVIKSMLSFVFVFLWVPLFLSMLNVQLVLWDGYHMRAKQSALFIRSVLKEDRPKFIYFNDGSHITFDLYPMQQVFKDATNEQLLTVNSILPEPIKYLFLKSNDWLFENNKDLIAEEKPILDGQYELHERFEFSEEVQLVVYKHKG